MYYFHFQSAFLFTFWRRFCNHWGRSSLGLFPCCIHGSELGGSLWVEGGRTGLCSVSCTDITKRRHERKLEKQAMAYSHCDVNVWH